MNKHIFNSTISTKNSCSFQFVVSLIVLMLLSFNVSRAQVIMNYTGSYNQDFNTLSKVTGSTVWVDNTNIPNWYWKETGANSNTSYTTGTGSSSGGDRYSFGSTGSDDRAMGSLTTASMTPVACGVLLRNMSGTTITNLKISYTGEQWRNNGNTVANTLEFSYIVSATPVTDVLLATGWTTVSALNFISPVNTATAAALDGNAAANRQLFSNILLPGLSIPAGSYIMVRWRDLEEPNNDPGIAIDDVTINWTSYTPPTLIGTVGTPFNYQIVTGNSPVSYSVTSGTLPGGLTLNTTTGVISGVPNAAGTPSVTITATNAVSDVLYPAFNFNISPAGLASQTISFSTLENKTYGDNSFDLTGTTDAPGLSLAYESSNPAVATVSGNTVTIVGAGNTDITASQSGNGTYNPAVPVIKTLTVNAKTLTIPDAVAVNKTYNGLNDAVITGTLSGIINADNVTLNGKGIFADVNIANGIAVNSTSTLAGTKATNYTLTQPTGLTANITIGIQSITFGALYTKTIADAPFTLTATASSGLTVGYSSSNTGVATVSGSTITIVGIGSTVITASQAGNGNYNPAPDVIQNMVVTSLPVVAWQFGVPTALGTEQTYNATTNNQNLNTSVLSRGVGITPVAVAMAFASNSWDLNGTKATATTNNEYFEFSIQSKPDFKVSLSTLDAILRRSSAAAPNAYIWKYSLNGTDFTEIGTDISFTSVVDGVIQSQIDLSGISTLQNVTNGTNLVFRLYAWGGTNVVSTLSIGRYGTGITSNSLAIGGIVSSTQVTGTDGNVMNNDIFISKNTSNQLIVNCKDINPESIVTVFNSGGKKLVSKHLTNRMTIIDNHFGSGVYLVTVVTSRKITTKKIIIN